MDNKNRAAAESPVESCELEDLELTDGEADEVQGGRHRTRRTLLRTRLRLGNVLRIDIVAGPSPFF